MRHSIFIMLVLNIFIMTTADAAIYKGQKFYVEDCQSCHPSECDIVTSKTKDAWQKMMKDKGRGLARVHLSYKKTEKSWEYFDSEKYKNRSRHLKDFLVEYAKDSGKVLVCE